MGSMQHRTAEFQPGARAPAVPGLTDYNDLTHGFLHELRLRTQGNQQPRCLFIDIDESGDTLRLIARQGNESERIQRDQCRCFDGCHQVERGSQAAVEACMAGIRPSRGITGTGGTLAGSPYDLLMSCHSISFIPNTRARCFLGNLRHNVRRGGMLFISAFGRYSNLGDHYPALDEPLGKRFSALRNNAACHLAPDTRLCLYSERDLCNTLFEAGWSVVRSATTTEHNVIATAIRV